MTKPENASERGREPLVAGERVRSFRYRVDPGEGIVICQVTKPVPKEGWREIEELIHFFRSLQPKLDTFRVELMR